MDRRDGRPAPRGSRIAIGADNHAATDFDFNTTGSTAQPGVDNTAGVLSATWVKAAGYSGVRSLARLKVTGP